MTYTIFLVEDHKVMAEALTRILQHKGNYKVAEVAASAEEALERLEHVQVDIALVDISLPHTSGIDLVSRIHEKVPGLPCLMISGHNSSQYVKRSLSAGARGFVLKDNIYEVLEGIQQVLDGRIYLSKQLEEEEVNP